MIKEQDFNKYAELSLAINRCCRAKMGLSAIMSLYDFGTRKQNKFDKCRQLLEDVVNVLDNEREEILKEIPGTISE